MKEKINNFLEQNWFKIVVAFTAILIGFSFFYSYTLRPILSKPKLDKCLDAVNEKRKESWKEYCKIDNQKIGTDGLCLLSSERSDSINERTDRQREECFKEYPTR